MHMFEISPVLSRLSPAAQGALRQRSVLRQLSAGEIISLQGELGNRVHLVSDGTVKLMTIDPSGKESLVGLAVAGDIIGDVSALDGDTEPYGAVAAGRVTLVTIERTAFLDIISADPRALLELAVQLAARVRSLGVAASERSARHAESRLAGRLLELANVAGRRRGNIIEIETPLRQKDLGRLSGMSRESASRTMRRLRDEGVLDYAQGRLRICRPDVLDRIRCGERVARSSRSRVAGGRPRRSPGSGT